MGKRKTRKPPPPVCGLPIAAVSVGPLRMCPYPVLLPRLRNKVARNGGRNTCAQWRPRSKCYQLRRRFLTVWVGSAWLSDPGSHCPSSCLV